MNRYTLYCTEAQIKKALELGAPIQQWHGFKENAFTYLPTGAIMDKGTLIFISTAEQMISWLEEKGVFITIAPDTDENTCANYVETKEFAICNEVHSSRKKAKLAAIDAALEYLEKQKEID